MREDGNLFAINGSGRGGGGISSGKGGRNFLA